MNQWLGRLKLLEFGTRREYCDWSFTLPEQRLDAIEILLPDTQSMRTWARLLALKARVEIAERKLDQAVGTIETGLAFGRHVAEGPFLINALVGMAICNSMLDRLEELIEQPGAPNLYWALDRPAPAAGEPPQGHGAGAAAGREHDPRADPDRPAPLPGRVGRLARAALLPDA